MLGRNARQDFDVENCWRRVSEYKLVRCNFLSCLNRDQEEDGFGGDPNFNTILFGQLIALSDRIEPFSEERIESGIGTKFFGSCFRESHHILKLNGHGGPPKKLSGREIVVYVVFANGGSNRRRFRANMLSPAGQVCELSVTLIQRQIGGEQVVVSRVNYNRRVWRAAARAGG